jgi:hypothetical protein
MDQIESNTHSFVVKIWLEGVDEISGKAVWRGRITHVPSGQNRHFDNLRGITSFVAPYLEEMGVELDRPWRIPDWLSRWLSNWFQQAA